MRIITNTNIIVDDFDYCKNYPKNTFIHFLTHFHQDHWFGLMQSWDYGKIYCSQITKTLILTKFPLLHKLITPLPLNELNTLYLNEDLDLKVDFMFFDANHIPGSIMILFQGYMGSILNTGDFRFKEEMLINNDYLFPNHKTSIHIDELIFDNTYCNPMFNFPKSDVVFELMKEIINKNLKKHVIIAMGALGKEDICAKLAEFFQTLIIISEEKLLQIKALNMRSDLFTTDKNEGFIEIISKKKRLKRLETESDNDNLHNIICITTDFLMLEHKAPDGVNYMVPYSLHSNYKEMESFIKAIKPCILKKLVVPFEQFPQVRNQNFNALKVYLNYVKSLNRIGESSYSLMKKLYTNFLSLSEEYKHWMFDEKQKVLRKRLGIAEEPDITLRKRKIKSIEEINQRIELEKMFGKKEKGESLDEIAYQLKSTHNNLSIKDFIGKRKDKGEIKEHMGKRKKMQENVMPKSCIREKIIDSKTLALLEDFANKKE